METRTIFFVGKPGCGKGTQAKLLAAHTGWTVIAAGQQFRNIAKEDSPVGRKTKEVDDQGLLQPHWFAMYLYLKALFALPADTNVIFDGFNRKVPEAELIIDSLKWLGRDFVVLNIAISDEEMIKRLTERHAVSGRADDDPQVLEERRKEYYAYTAAAIELFRKAGVLVEINGEQTPEKVAADIVAALKL